MTDEEREERRRVAKRDRYRRLKAERKCVRCEAGLQRGDGVHCIECAEEDAVKSSAYRRRHPEVQRARAAKMRASNREAYNRTARENRLARKIRGQCTQCIEDALPDCNLCAYHRGRHKLYSTRYLARRKGESPPRLTKARQVVAAKRSRPETVAGYRPVDEQLESLRTRLLRAMRFMDWATSTEVFEAAGIPEGRDSVERNNGQVALGRLVHGGFAERRRANYGRTGLSDAGCAWEYLVTDAGRADIEARIRRAMGPAGQARRAA